MSDPFYRSREWLELRREVLRYNPLCSTPGCRARAVAVDHVRQRSRGGSDTLDNLRGLCTPCHNQRRRGGEPAVVGCDANGNPIDPKHWWNHHEK